ncbi:MAG: permease [Acidobacteriota bacterium]|nr:permease [Acidobacteriota bacterium]
MDFLSLYGEAAKTAVGFFWKAGWAFVLGYTISAMIQAFVPERRLTRHMGQPDAESVGLATAFGAASSSCSFAALAAARSLLAKGAHFISAVAFMFASTNLVIELGILILIFLGWQYLVAELIGGLLLILVSSLLIRWTYPKSWIEAAREKAQEETPEEEESFSPMDRITSLDGWRRVGHGFVMEWQMVWQEILVGFTIAGFVKVLVPESWWKTLFLADFKGQIPDLVIALENAVVAPFVAALTFIGSMGNIPLASVLAGSGAAFAGVMGFIYSDLMVPPLVRVNARYYGWKVALYIAGVMFVSIVVTALALHLGFGLLGLTPDGAAAKGPEAQFQIDYTFWLNLVFLGVAGAMVLLHRQHRRQHEGGGHHMQHGGKVQTAVTYLAMVVVAIGLVVFWVTGS